MSAIEGEPDSLRTRQGGPVAQFFEVNVSAVVMGGEADLGGAGERREGPEAEITFVFAPRSKWSARNCGWAVK